MGGLVLSNQLLLLCDIPDIMHLGYPIVFTTNV